MSPLSSETPLSPKMPLPPVPCVECGAPCAPAAAKCWMCGRTQPVMAELVAVDQWSKVKRPLQASVWTRQSAIAASLVLLVLVGVLLASPGMGVLLAICAVPAAIRARRELRRSATPLVEQTVWQKLGQFAMSFLLVTGAGASVVVLLGIGAVVALFAICLSSAFVSQ